MREYFNRLWAELAILAGGSVILLGLLTVFVKGGLYIPVTGGVGIFTAVGFVIANIRLVNKLMREKSVIEAQRGQLQNDRTRLTEERDEARHQRDFLQTAMALLQGETRPVTVTVVLSPNLAPPATSVQPSALAGPSEGPAPHDQVLPEELTPPADESNVAEP
jgi:hypothetical protein